MSILVGVVEGRADSVLTTASVHVRVDFLGWDGRGLWLQFVDLIVMSLGEVLFTSLVKV